MTTTTHVNAQGYRPAKKATKAGDVVCQRTRHPIDASVEFTTAQDRIELGILPAGHLPLATTQVAFEGALDGGSALVWSLGVEKADGTTGGSDDVDALIAAATVGRGAAGVQGVNNFAGLFGVKVADFDRKVFLYAATPPGTDADTAVQLELYYTAADRDD